MSNGRTNTLFFLIDWWNAKYKDELWRRALRTAATQARRNIGVACQICFGMSRNGCRSSQKSYKGITESSKTKRAYFAILYVASFYSSIIHQMIDFRSIKLSRSYQSEIISNDNWIWRLDLTLQWEKPAKYTDQYALYSVAAYVESMTFWQKHRGATQHWRDE